MGTLSWSITESGRLNRNIQSSRHVASGTFTTSTSPANVTSLSPSVGDIVVVHADEAMRIRFGDTASATNSGHYLVAGQIREFDIAPGDDGAVSVTDVA